MIEFLPYFAVFIHGLFLDGAAWNHHDSTLTESAPKKLFSTMPVMMVTAVTKNKIRNNTGDYGPYGPFSCPVYKYPRRTDKYLIFSVQLPSKDHRPLHWILRGVALLCATQ